MILSVGVDSFGFDGNRDVDGVVHDRESIYRLLPQTTAENISKNFEQHTIDPATRYPNLNSTCVRPHQVRLTLYVFTYHSRLFFLRIIFLYFIPSLRHCRFSICTSTGSRTHVLWSVVDPCAGPSISPGKVRRL